MQVKRFVAANMRLALKMVREDMGPDAVILSNKRVPEGVELLIAMDAEAALDAESTASTGAAESAATGNPFQQAVESSAAMAAKPEQASKLSIELEQMQQEARQRARALAALMAEKNAQQLAAAVDTSSLSDEVMAQAELAEDKVDFSQSLQAELNRAEPETEQGKLAAPSAAEVATTALHLDGTPPQDELSEMRVELQSMRDLLEQQFRSMAWASFSQQHPQQASIRKRLKRMGIGPTVAESLLSDQSLDEQSLAQQSQVDKPAATGGKSDAWQRIMAGLCDRLPVMEQDLVADGGVFAFVGPTGAGKTTTIGKLAARYVLEKGADSVALVTTDTLRIAAHEQLRTLGRILNVPVKIVDKNNSLERVLYSLRHKSLVLIDTAGLNRQDSRLQRQLDGLNEAGNRLRTVLVLPTTSQVAVIKSAYYTYQTDNLCGCVLTKLDESASLGEALTLTIDKSLPVAYVTDGQGIPDDIEVAQTTTLVRSAIALAKQVATDEAAMAEEFGGSAH